MNKKNVLTGLVLGGLILLAGPRAHGGSVSFAEEVVYALEQSEVAVVLKDLEFHPVATGQRIGKQYPGLSGGRLGPYECLARVPGSGNAPGVYTYRVVIATEPTFFDADGKETTLKPGAVSKMERATGVIITPLSPKEADTGAKDKAPVVLSEILGGNESNILEREFFFIDEKPLRVGATDKEVEALLKGHPVQRGKAEKMEATGETIENWKVDALGLEMMFVLNEDNAGKTLASVWTSPGSKVETARGIKLGHSEARVRAAYADLISDRDSTPGELVTVGNMYLGLFVQIENGKVQSFYLGRGAE
jgi:hypothetical protein